MCRRALLFAVLAVGVTLTAGCATSYRYFYPGCKDFTEDQVSQLYVGMPPEEIVDLLGVPQEQYTAEFGADVGEPWTGRAFVYFTELDRDLKYAKRYKKNLLVFYPSEGAMKLNHWELE